MMKYGAIFSCEFMNIVFFFLDDIDVDLTLELSNSTKLIKIWAKLYVTDLSNDLFS